MFLKIFNHAKAQIRGNKDYTNNCPHPYHVGDLPPLIENNGNAYMNVLIKKFKIKDIIGKVIIIHDMPDDFTTQPSGKSGNKIACGKII